jgi:hypothetical protein
MRKSGLVETVGRKNFAADIFAALDIAKAYLETLQKKEQE